MDDAVLGSQQRNVQRVLMQELVAQEPLKKELEATELEVREDQDVAGETCYQVYVKRTDGREVIWFISKRDHLPRRLDRIYTREGAPGTTQLEIEALTVDTKLDPSAFKPEIPEGFTKTDEFAP
jgi:outer membrane lipoprotein-sorting protein